MAKKIRITEGEYWSEGLEGLVLTTYGDEKWGDEIHYYVDPPNSGRGRRFIRDCCCEVVTEEPCQPSGLSMADIPHGVITSTYEEDFPEYANYIAEDLSPNMVDHPPHYNSGKYEVIDIIEDSLRDIDGGFEAYCLGHVEKYTKRYRHKNGVEDLRKAAWYLNKAIEHIEARN